VLAVVAIAIPQRQRAGVLLGRPVQLRVQLERLAAFLLAEGVDQLQEGLPCGLGRLILRFVLVGGSGEGPKNGGDNRAAQGATKHGVPPWGCPVSVPRPLPGVKRNSCPSRKRKRQTDRR